MSSVKTIFEQKVNEISMKHISYQVIQECLHVPTLEMLGSFK